MVHKITQDILKTVLCKQLFVNKTFLSGTVQKVFVAHSKLMEIKIHLWIKPGNQAYRIICDNLI